MRRRDIQSGGWCVQTFAMAHDLRCFFLTLFCCFLLGEGQCETYHVQCREVLQVLDSVTTCHNTAFYGGAHILKLCDNIAIRMSMLTGSTNPGRIVVRTDDIIANVPRSHEDSLREVFLDGMEFVRSEQVLTRALIRESEFQGEARWLHELQFKRLVFPPAIPVATCKLCIGMNSSNQIPVYQYSSGKVLGRLPAELVVGISVMNQVKGSVDSLRLSLARPSLLSLLVGYHCDLQLMTRHGHLHDAHSGNILVSDEDDFRWHDLGESFRVSQSSARLNELRDHVVEFAKEILAALSATSPTLARELEGPHPQCMNEFNISTSFASECLGRRAFEFALNLVKSQTLDEFEKRKVLQRVSRGFDESDMNALYHEYTVGAVFADLSLPDRPFR